MTEVQPGVIFSGVDGAYDQARVDASLGGLGVDLNPLTAPDGSVQRLRDMDTRGAGSRDNLWRLTVEELFGTIKEIRSGIGGTRLDRGYSLRDIAPVVPNPFFKEPTANPGSKGTSFSGKSRWMKLSQERLQNWEGKVIEPQAWSDRIDEKFVTLDSLAVLIQLRPS